MLCGLTHDDIWTLQPYQVIEYIKRYKEKEIENVQIQLNLQHNLIWSVYYAIHNPKKLQEKPIDIIKKSKKPKEMTDAELCLAIDAL